MTPGYGQCVFVGNCRIVGVGSAESVGFVIQSHGGNGFNDWGDVNAAPFSDYADAAALAIELTENGKARAPDFDLPELDEPRDLYTGPRYVAPWNRPPVPQRQTYSGRHFRTLRHRLARVHPAWDLR